MRIISGSARGIQLATFSGNDIRPTSDRVRGAIFSILSSRIGSFDQLNILDIFAGTGAMGLEAISRSANKAVFIDHGQQAKQLIETNFKRCKFDRQKNQHKTINQSAKTALPQLAGQLFDIIFMDPPYSKDLVPELLLIIAQHKLLHNDGIICIEEDKKTILPEVLANFTQIDRRKYGNTVIYLYKVL